MLSEALKNKISKYYSEMTSTEHYIAKKILANPAILKLSTLQKISEKVEASTTAVYRFMKKIGFENVFELKHWIIVQEYENSSFENLAIDVDYTIKKYQQVSATDFLFWLKDKTIIYIVARGDSAIPANLLMRNLLKLGYQARLMTSDDASIIRSDAQKKIGWIFLSIFGISTRYFKNTFFKYSDSKERILLSTFKQPPKTCQEFHNVFYAYSSRDFSDSQALFPKDMLILFFLVINILSEKLELEKKAKSNEFFSKKTRKI